MFGDPKDFLPGALHKCGVSVDISSFIFGYDRDKLKDGPKTIADVFDTTKWPGRRGFRKSPKQLFEHVLMADGVPPEKVYEVLGSPGGVDRVLKKLDTIKKDIVWWSTNAQAPQLLADGEVVITEIFNAPLRRREEGSQELRADLGRSSLPLRHVDRAEGGKQGGSLPVPEVRDGPEGAGPLLVHLPVPAEPSLGAAVRLQGDATESSHGAGELQAGAVPTRVVGGSLGVTARFRNWLASNGVPAGIPTSAGRFSGWVPAG